MKKLTRPYSQDPELPEETPELLNEIFRSFKEMGIKPEEVYENREEYAAWLLKPIEEEHDE